MKLVSKKIEEYCVNQSLSDNKLLKAGVIQTIRKKGCSTKVRLLLK